MRTNSISIPATTAKKLSMRIIVLASMLLILILGNGGISQVQGMHEGYIHIQDVPVADFPVSDLKINHEISYKEKIMTNLTRVSDDLIIATLYIENTLETVAQFTGNSSVLLCENGSMYRAPQEGMNILGNSYAKIEVEFYADSLAGFEREGTNQHSIPCTINPSKQVMEATHDNNSFNLRLFHPDKYPDVVWTEVTVTPNPIVATPGQTNYFKITAKGENVGADSSSRGTSVMVSFPNMYDPVTGEHIWGQPSWVTLAGNESWDEEGDTFSWEYTVSEDGPGFRWSPEPRTFEIWMVDNIAHQSASHGNYYDGAGPIRWGGYWAAYMQLESGDKWGAWDMTQQPLEFGSEDIDLISGYTSGMTLTWRDLNDPIPDSVTSNNLYRGTIRMVKPQPDVLYPDDGKVFQVGEYPDFRDDWRDCQDCSPSQLPSEFDTLWDWKLAWIDNELLRFRWDFWGYQIAYQGRIQIYDSNNKIVHDEDLETLKYFGGSTTEQNNGITGTGITADGEMNMPDKFQQYIGPDLGPGTYKWRAKLGDKNTDDFMAPWSDFRSFTITTNNLSGSDFTGKVTGVDADNEQAAVLGKIPGLASPLVGSLAGSTVLTVTTEDGSVVPVIADQSTTISNPMNSDDIQEIETDWNVMVTANQPPAIGAYLSRSYMATASEITVIPNKPFGSHKRCTVVGETSDGKSSLVCEDGEEIDVDQTGLPAGTNAVILVHPEQPAQVISTAKSLMERMNRFQTSAQNQKVYDFSALDALINNVNAGFFAGQEMAIAQASPEVQLFMENLTNVEQRIASLAAGFASGGNNIVVSTGDIDQLIGMLNEVAASPDKLVDMMIDGYGDTTPQEDRDELKALIKSESAPFFSTMSADLYEAISLLEEGDIETALEKLDAATADSEAWDQNTVVPIMNQFYGDMEADLIAEFTAESEKLREEANTEILMVEEFLGEADTSWMEPEMKAAIEDSLSQLKTAVAGDDVEVIFSALESMVAAMQALPEEGQISTGQEDDGSIEKLLSDAQAEIDVAQDILENNPDSITPEDHAIIQARISDLQGQLLGGKDRDAIYAALMALAEALEALPFEEAESSAYTPLTSVNIQCPPTLVVGHQMGCSFSYDGMLESHEWTAAFSADGSQMSSGSQLFTATYDEMGTVSLSLTACDANSCIQASHTIEIVEPKQNGGEHTPENQDNDKQETQSGDHTDSPGNQK